MLKFFKTSTFKNLKKNVCRSYHLIEKKTHYLYQILLTNLWVFFSSMYECMYLCSTSINSQTIYNEETSPPKIKTDKNNTLCEHTYVCTYCVCVCGFLNYTYILIIYTTSYSFI